MVDIQKMRELKKKRGSILFAEKESKVLIIDNFRKRYIKVNYIVNTKKI